MDQAYKDKVIMMISQSSSPVILLDEELKVLACSLAFYRCVIGFRDDIRSLFNANAIQRIKRARKAGSPMKIKTETSPFILSMSINWLPSDTEIPYLFGIVERNPLHDANRSLVLTYSCVERSKRSLEFINGQLMALKQNQPVSQELLDNMIYHANILNRNHKNLLNCVDLLTDDLVMKKKVTDIIRIVRLSVAHAQDKIAGRNIKIVTSFSQDACPIECDLKHFTSAICECLYCILYFTQDNHHIRIKADIENGQCHIIFADPLFKIPDVYLDRIFLDDVMLPDSSDHAGLYFANAIIRKHGGTMEIDNSLPIGYQIQVTMPIHQSQRLTFEDYDDSCITTEILHYAEMELFDL